MMTSNCTLEDRGKLIGDVPAATTILDCFLHHTDVIIVTVTGKSYRLRDKTAGHPRAKDQPTEKKV